MTPKRPKKPALTPLGAAIMRSNIKVAAKMRREAEESKPAKPRSVPAGSGDSALDGLRTALVATGDLPTRQRLVLAAWASAPPGEKVAEFARRAGIAESTWYAWRTDPDFSAELEKIIRHRCRLNLEFFAERIAEVDAAVYRGALDPENTAAATLVYKRLGILREQVDLTTERKAEVEPTIEELEARLAQLANVLEAGTKTEEEKGQ
jgi:hypothetical protein